MLIFQTLIAIIILPRLLPCEVVVELDTNNQAAAVGELKSEAKLLSPVSDIVELVNGGDTDEAQVEDSETSESVAKIRHDNSARRSKVEKDHDKRNQTRASNAQQQQQQQQQSEGSNSNSKSNGSRSKLKFFQSKKISLTSLLPKSKRQDGTNAPSQKGAAQQTSKQSSPKPSSSMSHQQQQQQQHLSESDFSTPLDVFLQNQAALSFAQPSSFLSSNMFPSAPMPFQPGGFHHHNPFSMVRQPTMGIHQLAAAQNHAAQIAQPMSDQINTAQSMENYRRIRLNKQQSGGEAPFFFASSGDGTMNQPAMANSYTSNSNSQQAQQQQQRQPQQPGSSSASTLIGSAAAAILLTEKAKSLLSQMNLGNMSNTNSNAAAAAAAAAASKSKELTAASQVASNSAAQPGSPSVNQAPSGLASMIKDAAEAWAATSGAGGNAGTGSMPTIVVENDGPTITTVDFNNGRGLGPINGGDGDDDEDVSSFYSEENDEADSEGSHEAKKIARPRGSRANHLEQQVRSSSLIQNENPIDYFYNNNNDDHHHHHHHQLSEANRKQQTSGGGGMMNNNGADGGTGHDSGLQNEYRSHTYEHSKNNNNNNNYPDSINAIKNQAISEEHLADRNLASELRDKLSSSNDDQIESLIRELQDLKQRKNKSQPASNRSRGGQRNYGSLSYSLEDYDDTSSGGSSNNNNNNNNGNNFDDDEDEQTRQLKRKLLARLRGKHEQSQRNSRKKDLWADKASSLRSPDVKIPLHALLMAALDRRMSPSEPGSQQTSSVAQDLIADERNRAVITDAQSDFNEVTSGLGTLLNPDRLYESLLATTSTTTTTTTTSTTPAPSAEAAAAAAATFMNEPSMPIGSLEEQEFYGDLTSGGNVSAPAGSQPLLEGGERLNFDQQQRDPATMHPFEDGDKFTIETTALQADLKSSGGNNNNVSQNATGQPRDEVQVVSPTTQMPQTTTARTGDGQDMDRVSAGKAPAHQSSSSSSSSSSSPSSKGQKMEAAKGRRDLTRNSNVIRDEEGDFDVSKQVEEFTQDNEGPLEPAWMKRQRRHRSRPARRRQRARTTRRQPDDGRAPAALNSVEFDDNDAFDASLARPTTTRGSRVHHRRRRPPKFDDAGYEQRETNFFNELKGVAADDADLDKNSSGIEDPIESASEDKPARGQRRPRRRPNRKDQSDQEDEADDDDDEASADRREADDGGGGGGDGSQPGAGADAAAAAAANGRQVQGQPRRGSKQWRPSMIDEEVNKMEREAKEKRQLEGGGGGGARNRTPPPADEQERPDNDDDDDDEGARSSK